MTALLLAASAAQAQTVGDLRRREAPVQAGAATPVAGGRGGAASPQLLGHKGVGSGGSLVAHRSR